MHLIVLQLRYFDVQVETDVVVSIIVIEKRFETEIPDEGRTRKKMAVQNKFIMIERERQKKLTIERINFSNGHNPYDTFDIHP